MAHKPKNEFEEQKERQEKARRKFYAEKRAKMVKRRTGLSNKNHTLVIHGLTVRRILGAPVIVRERWFISKLNGRKYHFAILHYRLEMTDGSLWTAKQVQAHDANFGYMLSITGLYSLNPA